MDVNVIQDFFVNYGFALDFNEDNQVALFFDIPKDESYSIKSKLLGSQRSRRFQIAFEHKERCTKKCVSWLRVAHATIEELLPITKLQDITIIDPINIQNEHRVMQAVARAAQDILKTFDTSLEQDNKMLEDNSGLTMNQRACVVMRRGEKEILNAYLELAKHLTAIEGYDVKKVQKYFAQHIKGRGREPTIEWRMEKYFDEFWIPYMQGKKIELEEMNNSLGE